MPSPKPSSLVGPDAAVRLLGPPARFVSRGGEKLEGALAAFEVAVAGRRCLDAGASTGGFTDCLLQRGAASVVALDVGYGQLDWRIRNDERVEVVERTNVRHVHPQQLGDPFDVVVADLSFISLVTVAPALAALGKPGTDFVLLVKPQFEAGRDKVGRGGVVKDSQVHRACVQRVATAMAATGYPARGVVLSTLLGPAGNREFLLWCDSVGGLTEEQVAAVVAQ